MTLASDEFIRRFLIHILPTGFHRIRHYGLFASHLRRDNLRRLRDLLAVLPDELEEASAADRSAPFVCRSCGAPMRIIEILNPRNRASPT